ncbi:cation-transporting P-type ATPase [Rhodococcoides corynebacterioides]|uniref:cation-transporting P-type ATPase n=1 Tax=Rhodococcoides corynebacterioides TaxID=53972 RepID=UPI001FE36E12|nr:cation-transporting P-type ATPase [Rhodococcus corynebacterioides]
MSSPRSTHAFRSRRHSSEEDRGQGDRTDLGVDPRAAVAGLLEELRSGPTGLSDVEAERRRIVFGPNTIERRRGEGWPRRLVRQTTHPLALLLWIAAALAWVSGTRPG